MNYPLLSDYIEAIKAAEDNFEQLKNLRPVLEDDGSPVMTSGNFAVVFKMKDEQTGKLHAVKCFLREQEGRAEAYRQIAEELEYVSSTFLTPIKYLDKELFVDTNASDDTEFPVLLMDWVEGETLDKYIRKHLDDQYELSLLAYQFSRLAMWLMPQPFAHGDLKPDNILVKSDGTLVLVDYDGMYVPAMKGQKARELGSPDFRHPSRTETDFDEHIDDFSLVLLLLSLKIIRMDKTFLDKYGSKDNCSVFVDADLRDIANSAANHKLLSLITKDGLCHFYSLFLMVLAEKEIKKDVFEVILKSIINETRNEFLWRKAQKICDEGKASEEQLRKAYKLFLQLSNDQYIEAKICLSCCLRNGYGCNKDENEGVQLLRSCCEKNNGRALLSLGFCYEKGKGVPQNYEMAIGWYRKAAEQGYQKAQHALGLCYEYGRGVPKSYELAVEWYTKASEQGYASAQCNLGCCYFNGKGVSQSYELAIEWYRKAAEQGNQTAQYILGLIYGEGKGVPQNYELSVEWHTKAAIQGYKNAQIELFKLYGKKNDFQSAIMWLEKAAEHDDIDASYLNFIGQFYEKKNKYQESVKWYTKAADKNYAKAQYKLALFYGLGKGVKEDLDVSKEWLKKAAEQGYDAAIKLLTEDKEEILSTEVTDDDLVNAWTDKYGVKYSADRKRLLKAPNSLVNYSVIVGTKVICNEAFYNTFTKFDEHAWLKYGGDEDQYYRDVPASNLESIIIPQSVLIIGKNAFSYCNKLKTIDFSDGIKCINERAFNRCTSIEKITMPSSVEEIGKGVFSDCIRLKTIKLSHVLKFVGEHAFKRCSSLKIVIPIGSRESYENLMPNYRELLIEYVLIKSHIGQKRAFVTKEIESVNKADVVQGTFTKMVCFHENDGRQTYLPLSEKSKLLIGDTIDLRKALLIKLAEPIFYGNDGVYGDYWSEYIVEA
jgi:TPR repeat protein